MAVAAIVLRPGAPEPDDAALTAFCRHRLARFKVPAAFIRLEALPRTANGKLRRTELRASVDPVVPGEHRVERPDGAHIGIAPSVTDPATSSSSTARCPPLRSSAAWPACWPPRARRPWYPSIDGEAARADRPIHRPSTSRSMSRISMPSSTPRASLQRSWSGSAMAPASLSNSPLAGPPGPMQSSPTSRRTAPPPTLATQATFIAVADSTERAYETAGAPAAAEAFLTGVAGPSAWIALPDRARAFLADEGGGAYADARLLGFDIGGLDRITAPVTVLTGDASQTFYRPIADALASRIPGARRRHLPGMAHASPITDPGPIAEAVRSALEEPPA